MKNTININEIQEPDPEKSCLFAKKKKLEEHVENHIVKETRLHSGRSWRNQEEWWDLLGKYEEWKEYNRQKGKDLIKAVRYGTKKESDEAFWILCDLYERFAEEELKNACLHYRTDHYHRLAKNKKNQPIGQVIEVFSKKNLFIVADLDVRNEDFLRYALCTCYRTEPSMGINDLKAIRCQRNRETSFRVEKERWYATTELMADHNPEKK